MPLRVITALLGLALLVTTAAAGAAPDSVLHPTDGTVPYTPLGPEAVVGANLDVLVARISAVHDSGATIKNPPIVDLDVIRVLRGTSHRGRLTSVWHSEAEQLFQARCGNETPGETAQIDQMMEAPVSGPRAGQRMLLAGRTSDDGRWHVSSYVRFHDTSLYRLALAADVARLEGRQKDAAMREKLRSDSEAASDLRDIRTANLYGLCRASTDIVFATFAPHTRCLNIRERLYSAPEDSLGLRINARFGVPRTREGARFQVDLYPSEVPMAVRRANWYGVGNVQETGPFVFFLRRQAALQNDNVISYRLADPQNGILPGDSATVRALRRIVRRQLRRGAWVPSPPPECGATIARFAALEGRQLDPLRVRLSYAVPGKSYYARTFQVGVGVSDQEHADYPLCSSCGELGWSDDLNTPYSISISRPALARWLSTLADLPRRPDRALPDSLIAMVMVRGPIDGVTRAAERAAYPSDLVRLSDALAEAVRADSVARRRVNYLKSNYEPLLAPGPGWRPTR